MGRVIKPDTEGGTTAALTETGKGGLLSKGYLRDDPAGEYVGDGETPAYVVTNASEGVVRTRDGQETAIGPGDGYRTIAVVTDRRVIVLVGNADDGDERITLPLVEVAEARAAEGDLVVDMDGGERWRIQTGTGRVDDVAAYVDAAAGAWEDMESSLDAVKRRLVEATAHRDDGEYDAGIEAAQVAYDELTDAVAVVDVFDDEWPAAALRNRLDSVRTRCLSTLADVRIGNGRAIADRAEAHWREDEYEAAHDAYDRARAEFEAVAALDDGRHDQADAVEAGLDRVDRAIEELRDAPLERAIEVDRRAMEADDLVDAIDDWRLARGRYLEVLDLDADDPRRRFAGESEKIRARVETVTERVVDVAREDGVDALEAGQWYFEAGKPGVAREELGLAREVFERVLPVAREAESTAVEELEQWLSEAEAALERAEAAPEETDVGDADTQNGAGGDRPNPTGAVEQSDDRDATDQVEAPDRGNAGDGDRDTALAIPRSDAGVIAPVDGRTADATGDGSSDGKRASGSERASHGESAADTGPATDDDAPDVPGSGALEAVVPVVSDGAGATIDAPTADSAFENHLRALDPDGFGRLAMSLLEAEGLEPTAAPADEPYDFRVERAEGGADIVVRTIHRPLGGPIDADELETMATVAELRDADAMLVTSSSLAEAAADVATEAGVRVIAREDIEAALDGQSTGPFGRGRIGPDD